MVNGNSQRGAARILNCSKNTVDRKLKILHHLQKSKICETPRIVQFDEMESIEHTKLKPLTIPLCVSDRGDILSLQVGKIPAKGHLAEISIKKYGFRENERELKLRLMLSEVKNKLKGVPERIITDASPVYPKLIKEYFPNTQHEVVISREHRSKKREMVFSAQSKKVFDPMFALNHTCAMLRDRIKRLTRRSWCTTKKIDNLNLLLRLYQHHQIE